MANFFILIIYGRPDTCDGDSVKGGGVGGARRCMTNARALWTALVEAFPERPALLAAPRSGACPRVAALVRSRFSWSLHIALHCIA